MNDILYKALTCGFGIDTELTQIDTGGYAVKAKLMDQDRTLFAVFAKGSMVEAAQDQALILLAGEVKEIVEHAYTHSRARRGQRSNFGTTGRRSPD